MRLTLRFKLVAMVVVAALCLLVLAASSEIYERRVETQIDSIRAGYLPKIRARPRLEAGFEKVARTIQDAAQASDADLLAAAETARQALIADLVAADDAMTVGQIAALRLAIEDYYASAIAVSRTLIAGGGEGIAAAAQDMQAKRDRAAALIDQATTFDEAALTRSFEATRSMQNAGSAIRIAISGACLIALLALSMWIGAGLFRSLGQLVEGFHRFAQNDFARPIEIGTRDELGDVAAKANLMAEHLQRLDEEHARAAWTRAGIGGLNDVLRGELGPEEVAERAVAYLARYVSAAAGVMYYGPVGGPFELTGGYALPADTAPKQFVLGEGLLGEAAKRAELTTIDASSGGLGVRSGLVDAAPTTLVFVPLARGAVITGVLELALVRPWRAQDADLVMSTRESIAIAMEVARARAASHALLAQTRLQASELERARANLEQKAAELAKASEYKSQFLASMSHELRTPLNAIIGFSEILHDGAIPLDDETAREYLGDILTSGRHLLQLINDVLDLAKVESGKLELRPAPIQLTRVIGEVMSVLRTTAAKSNVRVEVDVDPEVDDLVLDPARLKQVLYNYVSNALKFTPERGTVTVRARPESPTEVRIEVVDTGIGIAPKDLALLFADYQQTAEGAKKAASTGLGLALTKRLVQAQGGQVGVSSTSGAGSTFYAVLPRKAPIKAPTVPIPPITPRAGTPTILVIEDDPEDLRRLVESLSSAGYAVEAVTTGREAVERCSKRTYDAITLDLLLPDMTGLEVLEQLRKGPNQDAPVVVVTVVAERGAVAGFAVHDILPKPLTESALLSSLVRAGVPPEISSSVVLVVDDDPASLKVMSASLSQLGYLAVCEHDPVRALAAAIEQPPSAIVLDLLMPEMSGFEFLTQLRANPAGRAVPVIVWTSKDLSVEDFVQLRSAAHGVVAKGDGNARVLEEIATHLPAPRAVEA